ncbi:hypothetical protein D3C77_587820 [compost metagenome]
MAQRQAHTNEASEPHNIYCESHLSGTSVLLLQASAPLALEVVAVVLLELNTFLLFVLIGSESKIEYVVQNITQAQS